MNNKEIARRLINNFLETNPSKTAKDFLKEKRSISHTSCFSWANSQEGYSFWSNFYYLTCKGKNKIVNNFLIKYFFSVKNNSDFIDLRFYL